MLGARMTGCRQIRLSASPSTARSRKLDALMVCDADCEHPPEKAPHRQRHDLNLHRNLFSEQTFEHGQSLTAPPARSRPVVWQNCRLMQIVKEHFDKSLAN